MRLNPDCIRDILMSLEQTTDGIINFSWNWEDFQAHQEFPRMQNYTVDEISYHVQQCYHHGFFIGARMYITGFIIMDISPSAHEFLANIRSEDNWGKVKPVIEKVGSTSLPVITAVAGNVIGAAIRQAMGLP